MWHRLGQFRKEEEVNSSGTVKSSVKRCKLGLDESDSVDVFRQL